MSEPPTLENTNDPSNTHKPKSDEGQMFFRLAALVILVAALYFARAILVPFALAVLLTFVLVPVVTRLERLGLRQWRLGRPASVLIIILCGLALAGSVGLIVQREFTEVAARWPEYRVNIVNKLRDGAHLGSLSVDILPEPAALLESAVHHADLLTTPFAAALLVAVMLVFMLLSWEDLRDRALSLISESQTRVARETIQEAATRVSRFLLAQTIINLCFGAAAAICFWIIHITLGGRATTTFVVAAGFLAGVLRFIPYIGIWIGASLPLLFTFAAYPNNSVFLVTLAMFVGLELFTGQFVEPNCLGASAGISATGVMISTVFWTWLWGPIGLLLSTPLTVLLVVMGKHTHRFKYLHTLFANAREPSR
jgi:predicted PurR-regulated permease PerM